MVAATPRRGALLVAVGALVAVGRSRAWRAAMLAAVAGDAWVRRRLEWAPAVRGGLIAVRARG